MELLVMATKENKMHIYQGDSGERCGLRVYFSSRLSSKKKKNLKPFDGWTMVEGGWKPIKIS
jgi:hypothetical protein